MREGEEVGVGVGERELAKIEEEKWDDGSHPQINMLED
jgi:hypothetical protein